MLFKKSVPHHITITGRFQGAYKQKNDHINVTVFDNNRNAKNDFLGQDLTIIIFKINFLSFLL